MKQSAWKSNQKSLESLEQTLSSLPPLPVTLDPEVEKKSNQRYQKSLWQISVSDNQSSAAIANQ